MARARSSIGQSDRRLGGRVLFPLDALTEWINRNTEVPVDASLKNTREWRGLDPPSARATVAVGRRRHHRVDGRRKADPPKPLRIVGAGGEEVVGGDATGCLLYTSDAADE